MGLGDELMATGDAARLYAETGRKVLIYDRNDRPRYHELFRGNPKIINPRDYKSDGEKGGAGNPIVRSGPGRRPYADYAAIEARGRKLNPGTKTTKALRRVASRLFFVDSYRAMAGEIYLDAHECSFAKKAVASLVPFIVLEPNIKGRVPAKQWGLDRWQRLCTLLLERGDTVVQIGNGGGTKLSGAVYIRTPTFRQAIAVMDHAKSFVVPEGGAHHAFGALHKKGVALFAGRTPLSLSYPDQMTWYIPDRHAPCGIEHHDCPYCRQMWKNLLVDQVLRMLDTVCES